MWPRRVNWQTHSFISSEQKFSLKITIYWTDYSSKIDYLKLYLTALIDFCSAQREFIRDLSICFILPWVHHKINDSNWDYLKENKILFSLCLGISDRTRHSRKAKEMWKHRVCTQRSSIEIEVHTCVFILKKKQLCRFFYKRRIHWKFLIRKMFNFCYNENYLKKKIQWFTYLR